MAVSFFGKVIIPFLAYFLVEVTGEQQYGGLGGKITLTPKVSGQPEDILWKHKGNKVVEFDGSQNVEYGSYKGRTILDWSSGALTIKGLADADSGPYELEAVVKGTLQYSQHEVDVIDDVAQPSITCVVDNTTPENMDRTLLCSADLQPLTQFIWRSPGGSESPGPELFIPVGENQDSVYTCVVKNPVSEKTAEFTLKDCYTTEGSTSVLAVVLSILLLLILVAVLAFLFWYRRKSRKPAKAALRKSEEEAGLMEVTVQGNKDPEDDHSENTGNIYSTQKGMVKKQVELLNMQDTDANRKRHTTPAGRFFSPIKSGHWPLYRQNDSLSDQQTVTDTEPVQDKPIPAQPKLVTPESKEAQLGTDTPEPNQETAPERETDSAGTTETGQTDSGASAGSVMDNQTEDGEEEKKDNQTRDGDEEKKDNQTGDGEKEKKDNQTGDGKKEKTDNQTGDGEEKEKKDNQTRDGEEKEKKPNQIRDGEEREKKDNQIRDGEEKEKKDNQIRDGEEEKKDNQTGDGENEKKDNQSGDGEKEKKDNQTGDGKKEKKDNQTGDGKKKDNQTGDGEKKDNQTGDGDGEDRTKEKGPYTADHKDKNQTDQQQSQLETNKTWAQQRQLQANHTQ